MEQEQHKGEDSKTIMLLLGFFLGTLLMVRSGYFFILARWFGGEMIASIGEKIGKDITILFLASTPLKGLTRSLYLCFPSTLAVEILLLLFRTLQSSLEAQYSYLNTECKTLKPENHLQT